MRHYDFTEDVVRSLRNARVEAHSLGAPYIGTEHMLLGVLSVPASAALLRAVQINVDRCRADVLAQSERGEPGNAGLAAEEQGIAARVLAANGATIERLRDQMAVPRLSWWQRIKNWQP